MYIFPVGISTSTNTTPYWNNYVSSLAQHSYLGSYATSTNGTSLSQLSNAVSNIGDGFGIEACAGISISRMISAISSGSALSSSLYSASKFVGGLGNAASAIYTIITGFNKVLAVETQASAVNLVVGMAAPAVLMAIGTPAIVAAIVGVAAAHGAEYLYSEYIKNNPDTWKDVYGYMENHANGLKDFYSHAADTVDPLIIDLDHDNIIDLVPLPDSSVLFDMNLDGKLESTGWVGADDGMLVLDVNGNGMIDNLSEVFSENFSYRADSGLGALALLDSNQDMVFDASDEGYGYVQVWRDLDQDGISDAGELMSLASLGVVSINLASGGVQERDGTWGYGVAA